MSTSACQFHNTLRYCTQYPTIGSIESMCATLQKAENETFQILADAKEKSLLIFRPQMRGLFQMNKDLFLLIAKTHTHTRKEERDAKKRNDHSNSIVS